VQSYYQVFKDLAKYVKQTYPQGIPWNPTGVSAEDAIKAVEESQSQPTPPRPHPQAATSAGGPPPPPPPGPPPPPMRFDEPAKSAPAADQGRLGAVFSDLNKGEAVTKGLRKVNPDQMTHKNPSLRAGATVPTRSDSQSSVSSISRTKSPAPGKKPKPESMRTKKPPVKRLDGNKWFIVSLSSSIVLNYANLFTGEL
jgi:adenylyl cyclase-associated protein